MNLIQIRSILLEGEKLTIDQEQMSKMQATYQFLTEFSKDKVLYGINTGFGPMAQYRVSDENLLDLQYNLIRSHACGAGPALSPLYVKAAMMARTQTFLQARSGVHPDLVALLSDFINLGITPYIPEHGSVGASGDLVQLSHIALCLIGEGQVYYQGKLQASSEAMAATGLKPLEIRKREGLAVTNGTGVMTGIGIVNLMQSKALLHHSIKASVLMNEISASYDDFMSESLNALKSHEGQNYVAAQMRELSAGSTCLYKREEHLYSKKDKPIFKHKLQPYYSLRCVPQILGPVYDTLAFSEKILLEEFNAVDDNPIVIPEEQMVCHGGNFHGDYVSLEMDKMKIAVAKLTMLTERQMNYLFHDRINGILPPFLNMGTLGLNYGLQAAQFTATSTTAENQMLSNPMYVHSIPNNNDNQDVVSMGTNAALITKRVIDNAYQVMAIHYMALAQAVDCLQIYDKLSHTSKTIYDDVRTVMPTIKADKPMYKEIELLVSYLKRDLV